MRKETIVLIDILFYMFAALAVISAGFILFTRNLLYAAFALVATFLCVAAVYVLAQAEFLAVTQLMIYVGGIVVLLIFGVMLTNKITQDGIVTSSHNRFLGLIISVALFAVLFYGILKINFSSIPSGSVKQNNVNQLGVQLMSDYLLPFEIAAIVLLVALVGAAVISGYKKPGIDE
ncbi:NADH-quinone oxidoreductase subunit J family protein [Fulvivirga ligni]|uniref:NADH-quinone oxidoreductase subunit J family protein n=1 Tax=Fulvivirga ligni TaxID=2904246 RepID=UPI001F40ACBF|nr:NADH-quinone oxidoreductase subunit J [Fulvivirga ligni]UII20074.1 NADH-quinone oxidoreductase subunit J [Fulvivirga ligni]